MIVGFGSIGQGVLPLILRHIDLDPEQITIVTAEERGRDEARRATASRFIDRAADARELPPACSSRCSAQGDFLLNLSVDVSSVALIELCPASTARSTSTPASSPGPAATPTPRCRPSQRSNYALRESALALRAGIAGGPTAVLTHGANPGLVSHFVKQALLNIAARHRRRRRAAPHDRADWARARPRPRRQGHPHRRARHPGRQPRRSASGEFVNTWSIDGFVGEGCQPAELGWGTHEKHLPADGAPPRFRLRRRDLPDAARRRARACAPGRRSKARSTASSITHGEVDLDRRLLHRARTATACATGRPCHYAYHPCDDAVLSLHELAGKNWQHAAERQRLMMDEIVRGIDELGVLLMGHAQGRLLVRLAALASRRRARSCRYNNATSPAGHRGGAGRHGLGDREPAPRHGRARRDRPSTRMLRDLRGPYLGDGGRRLLATGRRCTTAGVLFPEDVDPRRPLAVQELPRAVASPSKKDDPPMTTKIARFLADQRAATPCLVVDLDVVAANYRKLRQAMPDAAIYYAVKANPAREILDAAGRPRLLVRYRQPERDRHGAGGRRRRRAYLLRQHHQEAVRHRRRVCPRRAPLCLRQPRRAREDRRSSARQPRLLPHPHLRRRRRMAAVAEVRLRAGDGSGAAARRGPARRGAVGRFLPCRLAAARPAPVGRGGRRGGAAVPRAGGGRRRARHAEHRRRFSDALPQATSPTLCALWRLRSGGPSPATSATGSRTLSSSPDGRWSATPASSRQRWC